MKFKPSQYQPPLPIDKFIKKEAPNAENVPLDVLFVGAGPAGLAGAIELAKLSKKAGVQIEIGVLEKAAAVGEHCLSGAVINPRALKELFPELKEEDFPFRKKVESDSVYLVTENSHMCIPTPPTMHNSGNYTASICEVVRWMGQKAEELGVQILAGFPAESLLCEESGKVLGVRTTAVGLNRQGEPGNGYTPGTDVTAKVTILTEGTRGPLCQAYTKWQNIKSQNPQIFALGVKEVWRSKKVPSSVIHTLGWPLPKDAFGGSFMYPMGDDMVAFGLVAGLDYKEHTLDVHALLQKLKTHKLFAQYLEGGELVEWGAKTIPEGGIYALPERLHGDGILFAGDTVGMVNVPALKGIHYAMQSGIFAARTAFEALKLQDYSKAILKSYDEMVKNSFIFDDLNKTKNMRLAFKSGFFVGGFKASLMTLTGGAFPGGFIKSEEDAQEEKIVGKNKATDVAAKTQTISGVKVVAKVDGVFQSANKTRDDIPSHLIVGKDIPADVADFYAALCPAGVYERRGDQLVVNAPNCVDCKATDVLGPRWSPREGGSGPQYKLM
ncbi:MAG: 4Fe-4S dicluster domain-containing protein [Oligoflexia bacterium]|nr:4Fe-4S dicluster domain-containing protein [Oligoflexia bacterium]